MGNLFKTHTTVCLLIVFTCFLITACEVEPLNINDFLPPAQEPPTPEINPAAIGGQPAVFENTQDKYPENMNVEILCEDVRRDACGLLVTLHALYNDVEVDLRLFGHDGVKFLPNRDVLPQGDDESTIARVKLNRGESRKILFPYVPSALELPGAYKVIVLAAEADTKNLYAYRRTTAYIILNEIGEFHLLPSEIEFNGNFRNQFTEGLLDMAYWIQFEGGERPHRGKLWLRVDSPIDEYQPKIQIDGGDAITFLSDGLWNPVVSNTGMTVSRDFPVMNAGGSRVAVFPFEMDRNGRLLDGEYSFIVQQIESGITRTETMPVVIQLFSDPQYPNEHWLGAHPISPLLATSTPNPTAVAVEANNILVGNTGMGGKYVDLNEEDANAECQRLATTQFDKTNLPNLTWTRLIANYNGTICQAYLDFVYGNVTITWLDFEKLMVEHNENLNDLSASLEDHRVYILPEIDQ
ncbi:MAG: hypothetical protein IAF02_05470 [Anaerolineae bacterium]|nr:hypothetical protein [Anaerolineae bacterium]